MNRFALPAQDSEPLPTINRPYHSVAVSKGGRLSARADLDGTLHLLFHRRVGRGANRVRAAAPWRAGPLRTCNLVFQALEQALTLLGEVPSIERSLQLSRLIDRRLASRLSQYALLNDSDYEPLLPHVEFTAPSRASSEESISLPLGWLSASVAGITFQGADCEPLERQTFVLVRRQKRWELWARMERANSGSMPCRRYACLCSTDVLPEEPSLAAELLLFAMLTRAPKEAELSACMPGLVSATRLQAIEKQLIRRRC